MCHTGRVAPVRLDTVLSEGFKIRRSVIRFSVVVGQAWMIYHGFSWSQEVATQAQKSLDKIGEHIMTGIYNSVKVVDFKPLVKKDQSEISKESPPVVQVH